MLRQTRQAIRTHNRELADRPRVLKEDLLQIEYVGKTSHVDLLECVDACDVLAIIGKLKAEATLLVAIHGLVHAIFLKRWQVGLFLLLGLFIFAHFFEVRKDWELSQILKVNEPDLASLVCN